MNRRKFIASSAIGVGALSMFPAATLANTTYTSAAKKYGDIFGTSVSDLPIKLAQRHQEMLTFLEESNYLYNTNEVVKLNEMCYAMPLEKKSFLGFTSSELGLIVKKGESSQFHILDESMAEEFNALVKNFKQGIKETGADLKVADFLYPSEVIEEKNGKENIFSYKNKLNNTITLKSSKRKARVVIC